jgi:hypothetical protein
MRPGDRWTMSMWIEAALNEKVANLGRLFEPNPELENPAY